MLQLVLSNQTHAYCSTSWSFANRKLEWKFESLLGKRRISTVDFSHCFQDSQDEEWIAGMLLLWLLLDVYAEHEVWLLLSSLLRRCWRRINGWKGLDWMQWLLKVESYRLWNQSWKRYITAWSCNSAQPLNSSRASKRTKKSVANLISLGRSPLLVS